MSKKKAQAQETAAVQEDKPLSVDDIPGAVAPSETQGEESNPDSESGSLHDRLSAFRERRTGGEGSAAIAGARRSGTGPRPGSGRGGPSGALSARRAAGGGGGRAALQARRGAAANAGGDDAAAKGKEILKQVIARMNTQGQDNKPLHKALKGVARGYQALENEVARLREELDSYKG
ncbi:MAG: hypothetical protein AAGA68_17375 [Pseudomonadota bacterium]